MKKYGYWLVCTMILLAVLLLCLMQTEVSVSTEYPLEFVLEQDPVSADLSIYESPDGTYYVFLPSYTDLSDVKITASADSAVSIGATPVTGGMNCSSFDLETAYSLTVNDQYITDLYFFQSANVATLFMNTLSGDIERVHKDKTYSEETAVMLYTDKGILDLSDSAAYLRGRGNLTWYYGKKPYLLTLSSASDVLGMDAAVKWILLANAGDATHLNNRLVMELASRTGQGWSPEYRYVDLYIDGNYRGLYMLTEKVEVGPSRLDLDLESGDFLCKIDLERRWSSLKNPIKTEFGRAVEISSPDPLTKSTKEAVTASVNELEQIIMSNADLTQVENFDLESWVHRYLLDEISGNIDSDLVSSYFYSLDGVYYAGPIWDYDMTFGIDNRNINPVSFIAKNTHKNRNDMSHYYPALYANESFYNRMVQCYEEEFLPVLNRLLDEEITAFAGELEQAAKMNYYCTIKGWNEDKAHTVEELLSYLRKRVDFLNDAWIEGTEYCTVQLQPAGDTAYWSFAVKKGETLSTEYLDLVNTEWIRKDTGETVDLSQPVNGDLTLTQYTGTNVQSSSADIEVIKDGVVVVSIIGFLLLFICLIVIDILQRRKERGTANADEKTHISP